VLLRTYEFASKSNDTFVTYFLANTNVEGIPAKEKKAMWPLTFWEQIELEGDST